MGWNSSSPPGWLPQQADDPKVHAGRARRSAGAELATFIANHRAEPWACDFVQLHDLRFAPLFAFFIIELDRRRVVHVAVARAPSSEWVAQQLRNATGDLEGPTHLIRDRDAKYGPAFDRVAELTGIEVVPTAPRAPNMNAHCERFLGSVRRECLDHVIILGERHLLRVLREYVAYFNELRPHQGLAQAVPAAAANCGLRARMREVASTTSYLPIQFPLSS